MATNLPLSDKQLISTYIQAKDTNRPVYMPQAFADDARLVMKVDTDAISFPPLTEGCDAISQVLVRNFGQTWDNVFTWCIEDSVELSATETVCQWLVCMTEKSSGEIRLGCGRYRWQFSGEGDQRRVSQLTIEIDQMNEQQELNAEAAKFIVYQHEFDLNSSEGGKSLGGVRLNEAGEDHVRQIAGALKGGATFPVLIERSRTSSRAGTEFNYGVHYNPELDNRRRLVVVKALEKMGVVNAGKVVSVSPSFAQPLTGMEAEQAYRRSLRNNNNGGNGAGGGGGGFGGGGFQ